MRCETHGLAVGPDGCCVLCRRASAAAGASGASPSGASPSGASPSGASPSGASPSDTSLRVVAVAALLVAVVVGAGAWARFGAHRARPVEVASVEPAPSAALGDATDLAHALTSVHIVVYSASWCPACKRAKAWLHQNQIPFEDRDVEASPDNVMQLRALNPRQTIPTFDIEGSSHVGFDPAWIEATRDSAAKKRLAMK
jgi:glutaredoxin